MVSQFGVLRITFFTALFLEGFLSTVVAQTINDTLINGKYACQGSEIAFTCETRGSPAIAWISDEFIGTGGSELGFSAEIDDPGQMYSSNSVPTTVATLTEEYDDSGVQVLVSTLRIIATAGSLTPSVTCRDERTGRTDSVNFQLLGQPDEPQDVHPVQISHHNSSCAVLVMWRVNVDSNTGNLTRYFVYRNDEVMTSDAVPISDTWMSSQISVPCGPHNISVNATNRCGESIRSNNFILSSQIHHNLTVNVSTAENVAPTDPTMATIASMHPCPYITPAIAVLAILGVASIVLAVFVVLLILYICKLKKGHATRNIKEKNPSPI